MDDRRFAIDHFMTKLGRLPQTMNTVTARREAATRVALMGAFLRHLGDEIGVPPSDAVAALFE